jgi:hypothetical protein
VSFVLCAASASNDGGGLKISTLFGKLSSLNGESVRFALGKT